jgi:hypothetical protein
MEQSPSWESNRFSATQEIPRIYGTRKFITAFTSARHLSLSWASSTQSMIPHSNSWRSSLILSSHLSLCLPSGLFAYGFPTETLYSTLHHTSYMTRPYHSFLFCQVEVSATNWSLVQSYRLWCVVLCDLATSWMRGPWPTGVCSANRRNRKYLISKSSNIWERR